MTGIGGGGTARLAGERSRFPLRRMIYEELRKAIVRGDMSPRQAVSVDKISRAHGVSRTPVREAVLRLADEGLILVTPQVGAHVAAIDLDQVYEAQFVRETLERACLAAGARSIKPATLTSLDRALREQRQAIDDGEYSTFFEWDETFHNVICAMSGFSGISRITNLARAHLDRLRRLSLRENVELMEELLGEHHTIVAALKRGEPEAADRALSKHLRRIFQYEEVLRSNSPELFVSATVRPPAPLQDGGPVQQ